MNWYTKSEKAACRRRRAVPIGGPGAPDCEDSHYQYDHKDWSRPVTLTAVETAYRAGWRNRRKHLVIISPSGFTSGAWDFALRHPTVHLRLR